MRIEYIHASKYGNGATVAEEFKNDMAIRGVEVTVHHIQDVGPKALPPADLYLFSSPGRFGKPIRGVPRFLRDVQLPAGTRYAILTTEMAPKPDRKTGRMPTEEEICKYQKVRPVMDELLEGKGLVGVAEDKVYVTAIHGPLEDGWQQKVEAFAARIPFPTPRAAPRRARRSLGRSPSMVPWPSGPRAPPMHVNDVLRWLWRCESWTHRAEL